MSDTNFRFFAIVVLCGLTFFAEGKHIKVLDGYDPGSCNKQNHAEEVLLKDRSDNDKILTCVKENNVYLWKSADGSSTLGEFVSPASDCSDVLNEDPHAQLDGFYWIKLKSESNKTKVWCDMRTDGGGFMLIGRKKTPETWTLPSNDNPLEPYGNPHWLSSLGDAPIMDFRVQMATRDSFEATKADWSYRLKSPRPLKQLMQKSQDCGYSGAGIAGIAYVKDLRSDAIHNLTCSKFGYGHSEATGFGWASMNQCLQEACPFGYAKDSKDTKQHDFDGAFSYSVQQDISGMEKGATAFVGCDGKTCCGCYGPSGGTKDYCKQSCDKAFNGGRITTDVYTWFWVRSSLPKKLWSKCMDYSVQRSDGKVISHKLIGGSVVPIEGRCDENEVNLIDGIVVVPERKQMPSLNAPGLLAYRKGNKEIYLKANGKWNPLAQRDKILKKLRSLVKPSLVNFEEKIENETSEVLAKVNQEVKPELKKLDQRLDAQNTSLSQRLDEAENEIKALKDALASVKPPPSGPKPTETPTDPTIPTPSRFECNPYSYRLLDENTRNKDYWITGNSCDDSLIPGWYRFGGNAGTQIATSCVPMKRCGTHAPGWMVGGHPTVLEGKVLRKVAFHWKNNCQKWSQFIFVINCGPFYVYYLVPPSGGCSLRYCGAYS